MQKFNRQNIVFVLAGIILLIIMIVLGIAAFSPKPQEPTPNNIAPMSQAPSSPSTATQGVRYSSGSAQKLISKLVNRAAISSNDSFAKAKILSLLPKGEVSGILNTSPNIRIEYINAADEFKVEILTTHILQAKSEAVIWFRSQGMSQEGICNLPVSFYLNKSVANQLRNSNITFNPLAEGC